MNNLYQYIAHYSKTKKDYPFIKFDDKEVSFKDLHNSVVILASNLEKEGVSSGHRVGILLENTSEFIISYYALLSIGAVAVLLPSDSTTGHLVSFVKLSQIDTIIFAPHYQTKVNECEVQHRNFSRKIVTGDASENSIPFSQLLEGTETAESAHHIAEDHDAVILFTSGTTGVPRGVVLSKENIFSNAMACSGIIQPYRADTFLASLPFYSAAAYTLILNTALLLGAAIRIPADPSPQRWIELLQEENNSVLVAYPQMLAELRDMLAAQSAEVKSLRLVFSVGGPLSQTVLEQMEERCNCTVLETYGLTEAAPFVAMNRGKLYRQTGSVGLALACNEIRLIGESGTEIKTGEIGELQLRGTNIMQGYLDEYSLDLDYKQNWFSSGDMFFQDEEGFLYFMGQRSDRIRRYGYWIYPHNIENIIGEHPAVEDVCVLGISGSHNSQQIKAYVVPVQGREISEQTLAQDLRPKLPHYLFPDIWEFREHLPRDEKRRIHKNQLK